MSSEFELKIINKPIYYIEVIALINCLVTDRYQEVNLTVNQRTCVDIIKGFEFKGCELFGFYIYDAINDFDSLENVFSKYDQTRFLCVLFDDIFSEDDIGRLIEDFSCVKDIIKGKNYLRNNNMTSIEYIFENTQQFIKQFISLAKVLDPIVMNQMTKDNVYQEKLTRINKSLKVKMPLDVAQDIMGKKFKRIFDFNTYYFVPAYFYQNRPMRTFDDSTQIIVYPVIDNKDYSSDHLVNVMKILGDKTRLQMIKKLSMKPMFGKELAKELGIVTSTVSHHLEQLRSIGLVHEERHKNTKYFGLNTNEYYHICDAMKKFIMDNGMGK